MRFEDMNEDEKKSILKWLLGQRYRAKKRRAELERRLAEIVKERESPIGGVGYDPLPRGSSQSAGAASITLKICDIEERIYKQKEAMDKAIVRVMDIIEYLPEDSDERRIFELHHLDGLSMRDTADAIPMSKSQTYNKYSEALESLMRFHKIQRMIEDGYEAWLDYICRKENSARKNGSKKDTPG